MVWIRRLVILRSTVSRYVIIRKRICSSVPFDVHLQGQAVQGSSWTA
jgi:hypothetical protein